MGDDLITVGIEAKTGRFLRGVVEPGPDVLILRLPRSPNDVQERYSGDPKDPFRPATKDEIQAVTKVPEPTVRDVLTFVAHLGGMTTDEAIQQIAELKAKA